MALGQQTAQLPPPVALETADSVAEEAEEATLLLDSQEVLRLWRS